MVDPVPTADRAAARFQLLERLLVDTRLGIDQLGRGVEARACDRLLGVEALVEDAAEDGRERRPQARRARRSDRELEAV